MPNFLSSVFHNSPRPFRSTGGEERAHFRTILTAFFAMGLHVGVWAVLLADLANSLSLSPGVLGVALTCQSAAAMAGLFAGGRLADRLGRRPVLVIGVAGTGAYLALLACVKSYAALLAVLLFSGIVSFYDLACNSLGGDHEHRHGSKVMTLFHAGFSGGAALGAFGSGLALSTGAGFRTIYAVTGATLLVLAAFAVRLPLPGSARESGASPGRKKSGTIIFVPVVVACVFLIFACFSTDAALEGYTSIYLRDLLGAGALLGGTGLAVLYLAGTAGRLASATVLWRVGERRVLVASGVLAACGLGMVVATGLPPVAAGGLLLVGVALSPVAPIVFSLVARAAPGRSGQAISVVTASGYLAFTLSPSIIGGLAKLSSLRAAFLLLMALCAGMTLLAWRMPGKKGAVER